MQVSELTLAQLFDEITEMVFRIRIRHGIETVLRRQAYADAVLWPDLCNGIEHLVEEAHAILHAAAVLVRPGITAITQELVKQVTVCRMDFDSIEAGIFCHQRSMLVLLDDIRDLICLQGTRRDEGFHAFECESFSFRLDR